MIVNDNTIQVDKSVGLQETQFSIKATGKAFRILSDGLYSDKILAVIRELCCNAYDAHVAKGNTDRPFQVTLPNQMEPFFSVKDFGIGLAHEDVIHLYTTYFESTKTGSNDFIGALGLGSKSPFSYVDKFSVISIFNGLKSFYTSFIGPDGSPSIARMGDGVPTEEENGLEVTFPVKTSDISTFAQKAQLALRFFKVKPIIKGNSHFTFITNAYQRQEQTWKLYNAGQSFAIQGNVGYPLNSESIKGFLTPEETMIAFLPLEVEFPIGELEPTASREGLSYTEDTVKNIKRRFKEIYDILMSECEDFFKDCKTEYEARLFFANTFGNSVGGPSHGQITNMVEFYRRCVRAGTIKLEFNGKKITDTRMTITPEKYPNLQIDTNFGGRRCKFNPLDFAKLAELRRSHGFFGIQVSSNMHPIYFDDLPRGGTNRLKEKMAKYNYSVLVRPKQAKPFKVSDAEMIAAQVEFAELMKELDGAPSHVTSTLPPTARQAVVKSVNYEILKWQGYQSNRTYSINCWRRVASKTVDLPDVIKYYVPVYDYGVVTDLDFSKPENIGDRAIKNFDYLHGALKLRADLFELEDFDAVYGLRKKDMALVKDDETWVNLIDHLRDVTKDKKKVKELETELSYYNDFHFLNEQKKFVTLYVENSDVLTKMPDSELKTLVERTIKMREMTKKNALNAKLLAGFNMITKVYNLKLGAANVDSLSTNYKNVLDKYPMLRFVELTNTKLSTDHVAHIADYVGSVEKLVADKADASVASLGGY